MEVLSHVGGSRKRSCVATESKQVETTEHGDPMSTQVSADPELRTTSPDKLSSFLNRRWVTIGGVVLLLLVLLGQLAWEEKNESLSWDEGDHIFAGYMSLKHRDFGLNPEHPPLVKMVAALPLLSMHLREPQLQNRYFKTEAYLSGGDLIFGKDFEKIIFRARMAASVFMLLLALLVFLTAREMFGTGAGFLALMLVVFEPNLLAHGAKVTTDIGAACFLLATIYTFYRYVKAPSWGRLLMMGLAAGLFCIAKTLGRVAGDYASCARLDRVATPPNQRWTHHHSRESFTTGPTPGGSHTVCRSHKRGHYMDVLWIPLRDAPGWVAHEPSARGHAAQSEALGGEGC